MNKKLNLEERKPIWIALSEFYLDTELQEVDFKNIANKIKESPYSFEEVKQINKYEVFPVLQINLLSVAGIWSGFNEEWLVKNIVESLAKRNAVKKTTIDGFYLIFKGMCKGYWKEVEYIYNLLKQE